MDETGTPVVRGLVPWQEMLQAFDDAVGHFVAMLRELPPEAGSRPVPGMEWSVAETAAHLIGILGRGLGDWRRGETLAELHELNGRCIDEVATRQLDEIADRIEQMWEAGRGPRAAVQGDEPFPLHVGVVAEVSAAISYAVWDLLVHGSDIARATGHPWQIPAEDAARVLRAGLPALRPWVEPAAVAGPRQRVVMGFSVGGPAVDVSVGDGRYDVDLASDRDADTVADPASALLAISGRQQPEDPGVERLASWFQPI